MATRKYTAATAPAGLTSAQVLALVDDGDMTKAQAAKYLKARMDAQVEAGRRPKFASRNAYEALTGKAYEFDASVALTHKQRAKASKPAKAKPAKAKPNARKKADTVDDLVARLKDAVGDADNAEILAAFTALLKR